MRIAARRLQLFFSSLQKKGKIKSYLCKRKVKSRKINLTHFCFKAWCCWFKHTGSLEHLRTSYVFPWTAEYIAIIFLYLNIFGLEYFNCITEQHSSIMCVWDWILGEKKSIWFLVTWKWKPLNHLNESFNLGEFISKVDWMECCLKMWNFILDGICLELDLSNAKCLIYNGIAVAHSTLTAG